jgi:hypothetical protein
LSSTRSAEQVPGDAPEHALARTLAAVADLPLEPGRAAISGELFAAWLPAANELSRKMSAPEHIDLLPITVFSHPAPDTEA